MTNIDLRVRPVAGCRLLPRSHMAANFIQATLRTQVLAAGLALAMLFTPAHISAAADGPTWPVHGRLLGKDGEKAENISGIACATNRGFPRLCLVIDDDGQSAQFVQLFDGELRAGNVLPLISDSYDGKPLELDGEGVAYADGWFYVVGSHGHPRDSRKRLDPIRDAEKIKARIVASSQVVRIQVQPRAGDPRNEGDVTRVERSTKIRDIILGNDVLRRFVDRRLENNGVTIEGIAILGARIFVGFRGPTLDNATIPVLSVSVAAVFDDAPPDAVLHLLPVGRGEGVRDLAPFGSGILVLAGPAGSAPGPYVVYWWDGSTDRLRFLADITRATNASEDLKPEAILALGEDASGVRVLILSDGAKEGGAREVVIPNPL